MVTFVPSPSSPHRLQLHLRSFASFLVIACVSLSWGAAAAFAGTYHITPEGAGERDGRDWANAQPWSTVPAIIRQLKPGDSILLASGTYELTQPIDLIGRGQPDAPITFAGSDTGDGLPELVGHHTVTDALPEKSSIGLRFPGEAHHWTVSNLRFRNLGVAVQLAAFGTDPTTRTHLKFDNLDGHDFEDFMQLQNASDVRVSNCDITRYAKKGFRYSDHIERLTFEACTADANGGDDTFPNRAIPNGFCGGDTGGETRISHITFIDCTSRNNRYAPQLRPYWNGDGFSTEEGTDHVTYIRCNAFDNHDGGFDDKADNTTYLDCITIGNAKGFRYWGNNGVYQNCLSAYNHAWGGNNASDGLWVGRQREGNLGVARVYHSTFFHNGQWALESYNGGKITATDCLIVTDLTSSESRVANEGDVRITDCDTDSFSHGNLNILEAPDRNWQGTPPNAFDPRANQNQGYRSGHRTPAKASTP